MLVTSIFFFSQNVFFPFNNKFYVLSRIYFFHLQVFSILTSGTLKFYQLVNPLLDFLPILGSSNSAANKDMMSKIWTNWDTII